MLLEHPNASKTTGTGPAAEIDLTARLQSADVFYCQGSTFVCLRLRCIHEGRSRRTWYAIAFRSNYHWSGRIGVKDALSQSALRSYCVLDRSRYVADCFGETQRQAPEFFVY